EGSPHADPPVRSERTSRNATSGGCGQPEGGIRAPAKGTSPDLGRGYIRTRSRLSRVVAAMRNSFVGENAKRTENGRKTGRDYRSNDSFPSSASASSSCLRFRGSRRAREFRR